MNRLELEFRKNLIRWTSGVLTATVHVENHLNPGVPDLSYVMCEDGHETGWLELKAIERPRSGIMRFDIRQAQFEWIKRHCHRVPVHLLLKVGQVAWLMDGKDVDLLAVPISEADMQKKSVVGFQLEQLRTILYAHLGAATDRGRS